jgi:hypothetical protein
MKMLDMHFGDNGGEDGGVTPAVWTVARGILAA